jgi:transcriptional regulator with XRE-family HTH domain
MHGTVVLPEMSSVQTQATAGAMLRQWRGLRGMSQLDLSTDSGVTQKHISFVETGRSAPSRHLLMHLSDRLDIPLRERNGLLMAGGFAPLYPDEPLGAGISKDLDKILQRQLRQHEPFPALLLDRYWNVRSSNEAAKKFFGCFIDLSARSAPRNLLHLMFDPDGLRPYIANWRQTAHSLLARVRRECISRVVDDATRQLLRELEDYPDVDAQSPVLGNSPDLAFIPIRFSKDGAQLAYFSLVTTVGTPQTVTSEELRLECMLPVDEAAEAAHLRFVARRA